MKYLIAVLAVTLYFNSPAFGSWSTQDLVLEGVYLGLLYIDCEQTRVAIHVKGGHKETNPLLYSHPTETQIRDVCFSVMFSQLAVVTLFPRWRTEVILFSVGFESAAISWNSQF